MTLIALIYTDQQDCFSFSAVFGNFGIPGNCLIRDSYPPGMDQGAETSRRFFTISITRLAT